MGRREVENRVRPELDNEVMPHEGKIYFIHTDYPVFETLASQTKGQMNAVSYNIQNWQQSKILASRSN